MRKMTMPVEKVMKHTSKDYLDSIKAINESGYFQKELRKINKFEKKSRKVVSTNKKKIK